MRPEEVIKEVVEASPVTLIEATGMFIMLLLGIVVLLNPDGVAFIRGIDPDPAIQNLSTMYGFLLLVGGVVPALGTGLWKSRSA